MFFKFAIIFLFGIFLQQVGSYGCACGSEVCCYGGNCNSYPGDFSACMCYINRQADFFNVSQIHFYFLLEGGWSPGFCRWCALGYHNQPADVSIDIDFNITPDIVKLQTSSSPKEEINEFVGGGCHKCDCISAADCKSMYPIREDFCWCPATCKSPFLGDFNYCKSTCLTYFKLSNMTDPDNTINFMPHTSSYKGSCACCGPRDPCGLP